MSFFDCFRSKIQPAQPAGQDVSQTLRAILNTQKDIMATIQQVQDALTKLADDTAAEKATITNMLADLNASVAALQAQLAASTAASPADLDALVAQITGIDTAVQALATPAA